MKKKLIAGLLAGVMAVSLSGCGASKTEEAPAAPAADDSAANSYYPPQKAFPGSERK